MRIALHDNDNTGFPNYALMKISAWHKAQGDEVEWFNALMPYDRVYSSKVFTFTPEDPYLPPDTVRGGTGYGMYGELPQEIDDIFPDYSLYPNVKNAIGFLTRGCIRQCPWCCVPKKEGSIRAYRDWRDVKRPDSRDIVFMDNNILACDYGISQMESMIGENIRIDFNQGMDARLVTSETAKILSKLKWLTFMRFSCDTDAVLDTVLKTIDLLKSNGVRGDKIFVYVLVTDIASAERRCIALRSAGVKPFAQPYRDFENKIEPTREQRHFANWVNITQAFNTTATFKEFDAWYSKRGRKEASR